MGGHLMPPVKGPHANPTAVQTKHVPNEPFYYLPKVNNDVHSQCMVHKKKGICLGKISFPYMEIIQANVSEQTTEHVTEQSCAEDSSDVPGGEVEPGATYGSPRKL